MVSLPPPPPAIVVIDLETTGLKPQFSHIVEIAAVRLDTRTGTITKLLDTLVREPGEINWRAWIFDHSSLTPAMVLNAPPWHVIKPQVQAILNEYPVTAFSKEFDFKFLRHRGLTIPKEYPCIMLACTPLCRIPKDWGTSSQDLWKWPTINEAWQYFFPGKPCENQHRAYPDARCEAEVLFALLKTFF